MLFGAEQVPGGFILKTGSCCFKNDADDSVDTEPKR